jgi:hypothetical protein
MVEYHNPILGLSFSYPSELGEVVFDGSFGETRFGWWIEFSRLDALSLHGRSVDYSNGPGGLAQDAPWLARGPQGEYRWSEFPSQEGVVIEVEDVLEVGGREIVVFREPDHWGARDENDPGPRAALFNLDGDQLPGVIVRASDEQRLPTDVFCAILQSMRVEPPSQPPPPTPDPVVP